MTYRKTPTASAAVLIAAAILILSGCPNELFDEISEDVLVESAGGRPQLVSRSPEPDETGVLSRTTIQAEFDMDLDPDSVSDAISLYTADDDTRPIAGATSYLEDTQTIVFSPDDPLGVETSFRVEVNGELRNSGGATMGSDAGWSFTTTDVNPNQLRIDMTTALTPAVSSSSPLYVTVFPFPIDPAGIKVFGPFENGNRTLLLAQEDLTDNVDQTGFVLLFTHDQDDDLDTSDPAWFYLDGGTGNVWPDIYNIITEFNLLEPSVEANPDLEASLGSRYSIAITASGADDQPDSFQSADGSEFPNNSFTNLNAAFDGKILLEAASRYHGEWFSFTVPEGESGDYQLKTSRVSDTVEVYQRVFLYEQTGTGPSELQSTSSTWTSPSFGTPYAALDTSEESFQLQAGTTYYLSIYTFWIQAFSTPIESGQYHIEFTKQP